MDFWGCVVAWARALSQILNDSEIRTLGQDVASYEQLRAAVQSALPPMLKASVQLSPIVAGALTLRCANGTVHLRLRVLMPQVLEAVRAAGFKVEQVKLKVEPMFRPVVPTRTPVHRVIPDAGRVALERIRKTCEGTPLADCIARLLERTNRR